jgi:hypothetical protein
VEENGSSSRSLLAQATHLVECWLIGIQAIWSNGFASE